MGKNGGIIANYAIIAHLYQLGIEEIRYHTPGRLTFSPTLVPLFLPKQPSFLGQAGEPRQKSWYSFCQR
jgi:hypothetical protein